MTTAEFTDNFIFDRPSFIAFLCKGDPPQVIPQHRATYPSIGVSSDGEIIVYSNKSQIVVRSALSCDMLQCHTQSETKTPRIILFPSFYTSPVVFVSSLTSQGLIDIWTVTEQNGITQSEVLTHFQISLRKKSEEERNKLVKGGPVVKSKVNTLNVSGKQSLGLPSEVAIESIYWTKSDGDPVILVVIEHCIAIVVYSIVSDECVFTLPGPVHAKKGIAFNEDHTLLAYLHNVDGEDNVLVFSTATWEEISRFKIHTTIPEDLHWCDDTICVFENYVEDRFFVYSIDGECKFRPESERQQLGMKTWEFSKYLLACGGYNHSIHIYNTINWKKVFSVKHPEIIPEDHPCIVYREIKTDGNATYDVIDPPVQVSLIQYSFKTASEFPQTGVGLIKWSNNARYLLTRNDDSPNVLWIWNITLLQYVAVLIQTKSILNAHWDPTSCRVAFCTGTNLIFFWSELGCSCVPAPESNMRIMDIQWNPNGESLLVFTNTNEFCVCYVPLPSQGN